MRLIAPQGQINALALERFDSRLGGRKIVTAKVGAQASQLLAIFKFVGEEFDSVQVHAAVADFSADSHRLVGMRRSELNLDLR